MKKFIIVAAMVLPMLLIGCSDTPKEKKDYQTVDIDDNSIILCLGNSLTEGYGTAPNAGFPYADKNKAYPALLAKKVNIPVENRGKSGISAVDAANDITNGNYDDEIRDAAVIIIELGSNDLFDEVEKAMLAFDFNAIDSNFVKEGVTESFIEILDHIKDLNDDAQIYLAKFYNAAIAQQLLKGKLYGLSYNYMFIHSDYEKMFKDLKNQYGVELINDIWSGSIWGNIDYMFDEDENGQIEIFEAWSPEVHPNAEGYKKMADNYFSAMKGFLEYNDLIK